MMAPALVHRPGVLMGVKGWGLGARERGPVFVIGQEKLHGAPGGTIGPGGTRITSLRPVLFLAPRARPCVFSRRMNRPLLFLTLLALPVAAEITPPIAVDPNLKVELIAAEPEIN